MKKQGSTADFLAARDRELLARFNEILARSRGVPLRDMFGMAARQPASRFWVSERHAAEVVSAMLRSIDPPRQLPQRRAMYHEILRRVLAWQQANPGHTLTDAVCAVVNGPAPEFYLTARSARVIIYNARRRGRGLVASSRGKGICNPSHPVLNSFPNICND